MKFTLSVLLTPFPQRRVRDERDARPIAHAIDFDDRPRCPPSWVSVSSSPVLPGVVKRRTASG